MSVFNHIKRIHSAVIANARGETAFPFIVSAVIGLVLSFVSGAIQRAMMRKPDSGPVSNGHLVTRRDHQAKRPRVYGRCRVGVNQEYIHTTGIINRDLHMICTF